MNSPSGGYATEMWRAEDEGDVLASELQSEVWEELRWEPELEPCKWSLFVYVTGRAVTLSGTVSRYPQKAAAERAACRVPGVAAVANAIRVELKAADRRADEVIAEEVRRVLSWDTLLPPGRIDVRVRDGIVTLRGEADREHQRTAAEQVVEPLIGITGLMNRITVRSTPATGDLKDHVLAAIRRVRARNVQVEIHGGMVELHGHVASLADREQVEHAVREIPGVTGVGDSLRIQR